MAALPLEHEVVVAAGAVLPLWTQNKKSPMYLCTKCSTMPRGILPLVILATYPKAFRKIEDGIVIVKARFHGALEVLRFKCPKNTRVLELLANIRKHMDKEFIPMLKELDERQDIMDERREAVLELMSELAARSAPILPVASSPLLSQDAGGLGSLSDEDGFTESNSETVESEHD